MLTKRGVGAFSLGRYGNGKKTIPGLKPLGFQDFGTERARQLVAEYDFTLNVGGADANPATILEAMAWGLVPVCTPQSGYVGFSSIPNIPLNDTKGAVEILRRLQFLPEARLQEMRRSNWKALDLHFSWNRFAAQVISAIESDASPCCDPEPLARRLKIRWANLFSPFAVCRPSMLKAMTRVLLRGMGSESG